MKMRRTWYCGRSLRRTQEIIPTNRYKAVLQVFRIYTCTLERMLFYDEKKILSKPFAWSMCEYLDVLSVRLICSLGKISLAMVESLSRTHLQIASMAVEVINHVAVDMAKKR